MKLINKPADDERNEHIYVVFSTTPYMMGRFVRLFTDGDHNHVSISVTEELTEIYSFARRYRQAPFYGGFVKESAGRFRVGKKSSDIMICAVPVSAEKKKELIEKLHRMDDERERYLYNLFSAICVPVKKRINVKDAYTCVEFALQVLKLIGYNLNERAFCSIDELRDMLFEYKVYEGPFPELDNDESDEYENAVSYGLKYGSFIKQVNLLAARMIHS